MTYENREILFKPIKDWTLGDEPYLVIKAFGLSLPIRNELELSIARTELKRACNLMFCESGVDILDIDQAYIHPDTIIGAGTVILPHVVISKNVTIGNNCRIGPFAYIRPDSTIGESVKIGDFVEIKNSTIGNKTSISHLTYVGDSDVGRGINFGCGTVTVNYDGKNKFRTTIEDGAFIGCNTNLIAPVTVGENAYTAAGSTITEDVPPNSLSIARSYQVNKENWVKPK